MSQANFIAAVLSHMNYQEVLDAVTKDADAKTARENMQVAFHSDIGVHGVAIEAAYALMNYVHNVDASDKQQKRRALAAPACEIVTDYFRDHRATQAELGSSNWKSALKSIIRQDDVEALMALDKVGLIDRAPAQRVGKVVLGILHSCWRHTLEHSSARCQRYLLATSPLTDLAIFEGPHDVWPRTMEMARDVVAHMSHAELGEFLKVMQDKAISSGSGSTVHAADYLVPALLERCSQHPEFLAHEAFAALVQATLQRETSPYGDDFPPESCVAMLDVLERTGELAGLAGFRLAQRALAKEKGGSAVIEADRLASLIEQGLPVVSQPGWYKEDKLKHLLVVADARHFEMLSRFVPDKTAFMQQFGWDFVHRNASAPNGKLGGNWKGATNRQLLELAKLGYPFGPIEIADHEGKMVTRAMYECLSDSKAADAFIIGHLCGHLDATHTLDGMTALQIATIYHSVPTIIALTKAGFDVNEVCKDVAAFRPRFDYLRDFSDYARMTPLVIALKTHESAEGSKIDSIGCITALIEAGADPAIKAPTGASTMQLARSENVKQLLRAARTGTALKHAIEGSMPTENAAPSRKKPSVGML